MTKEELMQLVDEIFPQKTIYESIRSLRKLSDAIDAALAQARSDALEEAAKVCDSLTHFGEVSAIICAKQLRALKEKND